MPIVQLLTGVIRKFALSLCSYIKRMRDNESYMTATRPVKDLTPQQNIEASQWLDPAAIPPGTSVVEALKQLHDYLVQDSLNIKKWLEDVA